MGGTVSRTDFEWTETEEPHACRRKEILGKYPEIKKLMVIDHNFKYAVTALVLFQFLVVYVVKDASWPVLFVATYVISGVCNHALLLAIHEIAHSMAFGHTKPLLNKLFSMFANLPIGVPCALSFKKYHLEHHKYQGDEVIDTDLPTSFEAKMFFNTATKIIWVILQPFFYSLRPLVTRPKIMTPYEGLNLVVQIIFDCIIYSLFGPKALFYMIIGSLLGMGLHPVAGHFISEHYMFKRGFETYSYYGPLNMLTFNVGYHNEHHDFPNVPGSLLPKLHEIAKEYYIELPHHTSWVKVIFDYITDPSIGPYARVKRKAESQKVSNNNHKQE